MHCRVSPLCSTRSTETICLKLSTYLFNFFIVTKRISNWHHFSASESFCSQSCRWQFLLELSAAGMLVDLSVKIMQVTVSVAIMQLEVSAAHMQVTVSAANIWVTIFIVIMQMGVFVAIIQVVFFVVHYAHGCVYCNYAGDFPL